MNTLAKRGIQSVADRNGWQAKGNRWHYPIYSKDGAVIATRSKAITKTEKIKYLWEGGKPDNPDADFYMLPITQEFIELSQGICYLANGEPSLLSFHAGGVHNVIATTHSETTIPSHALEYLQSIGVKRLINIADNDDAGLKGATKWRDLLRETGIQYQALAWDTDKPKYDANDAWIECGFNADSFTNDYLSKAKALLLPTYEKPVKQVFDDKPFDGTPDGLIEALISALHVTAWRHNGWSKNVSSPFHEDKHPSFGIRRDTGVSKDFATGESYSPMQIADALGIDWKRFYPSDSTLHTNDTKPKVDIDFHNKIQAEIELKKSLQQAKIGAEMYESEAYPARYAKDSFINQDYLPKSWVQALLGLAVANSAVVPVLLRLHHALRIGRLNRWGFTRKELDTVMGSRKKSTTAALETLCLWGFVSKVHIVTTIDYSDTNDTKPKVASKKGGRPTEYKYQVSTTDAGLISAEISEMMQRKIIELVSKSTLAPRVESLASQLGLSRQETKDWQARLSVASDDSTQSIIDMFVARWREIIWDYAPLEISEFKNAKDIRVFMLHDMLADEPKGVQLSNTALGIELGCSQSNLSKLYKVANVESQRMRKWHTVTNLDNLNFDEELKTAQRDNQGKALAIQIKYTDKDHPGKHLRTSLIYGLSAWYSALASYKGRMTGLTIMVEQPSLIRLIKPLRGLSLRIWQAVLLEYLLAELPDVNEYEAAQSKLEVIDTDIVEAEIEIVDLPVEKPKRSPQSGKVDRDWTRYGSTFIWNQLNLEAHVLTDEGVIPTALTPKQAIEWIADNSNGGLVRTVESYFDKDDGESTLIDFARYLGGEKVSGLNLVEKKPLPEPVTMPSVDYSKPEYEAPPKASYEVVARGLGIGRKEPKQKQVSRFSFASEGV